MTKNEKAVFQEALRWVADLLNHLEEHTNPEDCPIDKADKFLEKARKYV